MHNPRIQLLWEKYREALELNPQLTKKELRNAEMHFFAGALSAADAVTKEMAMYGNAQVLLIQEMADTVREKI